MGRLSFEYYATNAVLIFIMAAFMTSCKPSYNSMLKEIELSISNNPDSALNIIENIDTNKLASINDRMLLKLLFLEASDKSNRDIRNYTIIGHELLQFYINGKHEKSLHPRVLYRVGRIFYDRGNLPKALELYRKALRISDNNSDLLLMIALHSQIAGIFDDCKLYLHELKHVNEQVRLSEVVGDTSKIIKAKLMQAYVYRTLDSLSQAERIYRELLPSVIKFDDPDLHSLFATQLASFYMDKNDYEIADSILNGSIIVTNSSSISSVKSIINRLNLHSGKNESVEDSSRELLATSDNGYAKAKSVRNLAQISMLRGNIEEGLEFTNSYLHLVDSIAKAQATSTVAELNEIYSLSEMENEFLEIKVENLRLKATQLIIIILVLTLGIIFLVWTHVSIRKRRMMEKRMLENQKKLATEIETKNNTIAFLKKDLVSLDQRMKEEKTAEINALLQERDRLMNALCLIPLSDSENTFRQNFIKSKAIKDHKELMLELEQYIRKNYPLFDNQIRSLDLSEMFLHDAMLIKIGLHQKECAEFFNVSTGNLGTMRSRLFNKLEIDKGKYKSWYKFIHSL